MLGGFKHGFYFFHNIWDNHPNWTFICFKMVETTNQYIISNSWGIVQFVDTCWVDLHDTR